MPSTEQHGTEAAEPPTQDTPPSPSTSSQRQRKSRETDTERAIKEIKNLVSLKLQVQQLRKQAVDVKDSLTKLFSDAEITQEEAQQLLQEIDTLAEYVELKRSYLAARQKAKPALVLLEECEMQEDEVLELT
ncbi:MAG: hypothetical protein H7Y22_12005 [Gemmatimonadaceae bacterium]|nr:hypothetical protein [Gloeobacterales cyanobacterium ES-bin-141]